MSLRFKLIGAFSFCILSLLLLQSVALVNLYTIRKTAENKSLLDAQVEIFSQKYINHLVWVKNLSEIIVDPNRNEVSVEINPHKCAFGLWYDTGGWKLIFSRSPDILALLESIDTPHQDLHKTAANIDALYKTKDSFPAVRAIYVDRTLPLLSTLGKIFTTLIEKGNEISNTSLNIQNMELQARALSVTFGIIAALVTMAVAFILIRNILPPIYSAVKFAGRIGAGDISFRSEDKFTRRKDEFGAFFQAFDNMALQLCIVVSGVSESVDKVLLESKNITEMSNSVSNGVSE